MLTAPGLQATIRDLGANVLAALETPRACTGSKGAIDYQFQSFVMVVGYYGASVESNAAQNLQTSTEIAEMTFGDPLRTDERDKAPWKKRYLAGWKAGVICSCSIAFAIFLINLSILTWTTSSHRVANGSGTLYQGKCDDAKLINTLVQIGINVLATLLLGSSNYCMQCLSAPTREELDGAHAKNMFLHVGVPSFTNLKHISRYRTLTWVILGLSALPIHFLYNSVLFLTTQGSMFKVMAGPEDFLSSTFNDSSYYHDNCTSDTISAAQGFRRGLESGLFDKLDVRDCRKTYTLQYVSGRGDLFLIQDTTTSTDNTTVTTHENSLCMLQNWWDPSRTKDNETRVNKPFPYVVDPHNIPSFTWQCPWLGLDYGCNATSLAKTIEDPEPWEPFANTVQYCWSQRLEQKCTLMFNTSIATAVIVCNLIKALCMCLTYVLTKCSTLITLGDAISSFMSDPDKHTVGLSALSAEKISLLWQQERILTDMPESLGGVKKQQALKLMFFTGWRPTRPRWWRAASPSRFYCFIMFVCALAGALVSIGHIIGRDGPFAIGVSTQPEYNEISLQPSLLSSVLIANSPQLLCSYIFLGFNYLLTCMFTGREMISFSKRRQTLRVTNPTGGQRSTYYLQLPYFLSIPLLGVSALLSWLTAQILFVVRVQVRSGYSLPQANSWILTCGYSPGAIVLTAIVGTVVTLVIFLLGFKKYPDTMPLAGTNSAAIAAACHALPEDRDCTTEPLQWGVVSQNGEVGHCSFSTRTVAPLVPGKKYR